MSELDRKHPPHFPPTERHNTAIIIFVTVCTKNRRSILANDSVQDVLLKAWLTYPTWLLGRFVIMPNHIHLFCAPATLPPQPLSKWIRFWKSYATQRWPYRKQLPIWQRHFWDTQLRLGENYDEKWNYIIENPVRAGLVKQSSHWPYQGELNILSW